LTDPGARPGAGFAVDSMSATFSSPTALTVTSPTPVGLAAPTGIATAPATAETNAMSSSGGKNEGGLPLGAIIGIAGGGAAVLLILAGELAHTTMLLPALTLYARLRRRRMRRRMPRGHQHFSKRSPLKAARAVVSTINSLPSPPCTRRPDTLASVDVSAP